MAKINTLNYQTVASWNGSQDLFVVEQTDGTKVATPEQIKQYVLNDMDNVPTQNSNNPVKSGGIFSTMAVPKYDSANRREYYEGGAAFSGNIDSSPTAGSNNAVSSGGTKTYVDNAVSQLNDEIGTINTQLNDKTNFEAVGTITASNINDFATKIVNALTKQNVVFTATWNNHDSYCGYYIGAKVMLQSSETNMYIGKYSNNAVSLKRVPYSLTMEDFHADSQYNSGWVMKFSGTNTLNNKLCQIGFDKNNGVYCYYDNQLLWRIAPNT